MTDTINGKTPDEIKKGLECCVSKVNGLTVKDCDIECPYFHEGVFCKNALHGDTMRIIQQLETALDDEKNKNEILIFDNDKLVDEIAQAERERDAAKGCIFKIYDTIMEPVFTTFDTEKRLTSAMQCICDFLSSSVCVENTKEDE